MGRRLRTTEREEGGRAVPAQRFKTARWPRLAPQPIRWSSRQRLVSWGRVRGPRSQVGGLRATCAGQRGRGPCRSWAQGGCLHFVGGTPPCRNFILLPRDYEGTDFPPVPRSLGPRIPPPHPRIASFALCAGAGGKSLGRSQGGFLRPRQLHAGSLGAQGKSPRPRRVPSTSAHSSQLQRADGTGFAQAGQWVIGSSAPFSARAGARLHPPAARSDFLGSGAVEDPQGAAGKMPAPLSTLVGL